MDITRQICFIIMPFSKSSDEHTEEYWTKHFESFLKPLIERDGIFEAHRSEALRGDILKQIITDLVTSPLVVADLTDANPNVYWELGVRQSFKHGTITIAEEGTKVPFDLSIKGILHYYPHDYIKNAEFMENFQRALKDFSSNPNSPDSHVLDAISGRGTFFEIIHRDEAIRRVDGLFEENTYNKTVITKYAEMAKVEKALPKFHLQSCSLELLLTQRYLDENAEFYADARAHLLHIQTINLATTTYSPEQVAIFFKSSEMVKTYIDDLEKLKAKLTSARVKLEKTR